MARHIGDQNKVLFTYESGTYAVASGAGQWIGLVTNSELDENQGVQQLRFAGGGNRNVDIHVDGPIDNTGTFTYHPQDWKFFMFALGSITDAGSPSPFTHEIKETDSDEGNKFTSGTLCPFVSFQIEDSQSPFTSAATGPNFVRTAQGAMVESLELSAEEAEIVEVTINYMAQNVLFSSGNSTAVTTATTRPFLWSDVKVHIPSGTVFQTVKSLSLSINNNLEGPHYLNGSRVISTPIPTNRDYELTLGLHAESANNVDLYGNKFRSGTEFNMMIEITDAGAGAGSRDMFITLSGCKLNPASFPTPSESVPDEQELTIIPKTMRVIVNDTIENYAPF